MSSSEFLQLLAGVQSGPEGRCHYSGRYRLAPSEMGHIERPFPASVGGLRILAWSPYNAW